MSMVTALRLSQGFIFLLACPMLAIGVMVSFSGGGETPAFQELGQRLIVLSVLVPVPLLLISEVVHRWLKLTPLAVGLLLIPLLMWAWLLARLQQQTGFFTP